MGGAKVLEVQWAEPTGCSALTWGVRGLHWESLELGGGTPKMGGSPLIAVFRHCRLFPLPRGALVEVQRLHVEVLELFGSSE